MLPDLAVSGSPSGGDIGLLHFVFPDRFGYIHLCSPQSIFSGIRSLYMEVRLFFLLWRQDLGTSLSRRGVTWTAFNINCFNTTYRSFFSRIAILKRCNRDDASSSNVFIKMLKKYATLSTIIIYYFISTVMKAVRVATTKTSRVFSDMSSKT